MVGRPETNPPTDAQPILAYLADYYPFGWLMPDRKVLEYRYGYQGNEADPETGWTAFQLRMYDGRVGRWMSVDPEKQYASPYLAMGNSPIITTDADGGTANTIYTDGKREYEIRDGHNGIRRVSEATLNTIIQQHRSGNFPNTHFLNYGKKIGEYNYAAGGFKYVVGHFGTPAELVGIKQRESDKVQEAVSNFTKSAKNVVSTMIPVVPDFVGIQVDLNLVGLAPAWIVPTGFGFTLSTGIGFIKGDGLNVYSSAGYAWGFDVSAGISLATGKYSGVDRPTWDNWAGIDKVHSLGTPVLDVQVSRDFNSANQKVGTNWTNLNLGLKTKSLLPFSYYYGTSSTVAWF